MKRLVSILIWFTISAAFIGPGTVTTAARAGAGFGLSLLWALAFSTLACLMLQEASARVTIATGRQLGQVIRERFGRRRWLPLLVLGAVVLGCAAYEMGNILGAAAGAGLHFGIPSWLLTLAIGLLAGTVLMAGSVQAVARLLGLVVALMGVAFLICAVRLGPPPGDLLRNAMIPSLPAGAGVLALGLVGTTVVPYNLFLGSGLARGQSLASARFGLAVAIPLGGIISMAIVVVGTAVTGEFSYETLVQALTERLGGWADMLFAFGLFAAGFSSAVTAPLAAALSVRGFLGVRDGLEGDRPPTSDRWSDRSWRYRAVWASVLAFGLACGLADLAPIPAIILAQALNGVILPLVAVFLWLCLNDRELMGDRLLCGPVANVLLGVSVVLTFLLGTTGVLRALCRVAGIDTPQETLLLGIAGLLVLALTPPVLRDIRRRRGKIPVAEHSRREPR